MQINPKRSCVFSPAEGWVGSCWFMSEATFLFQVWLRLCSLHADSLEHPLGALVCHQGPHHTACASPGEWPLACVRQGVFVFLTPRKFCASLLLALTLFLCRFRGCPFCCCWRVTRNGSECFSEVTVSVMQVMLEGPSVPSGGLTAPRPSPALVTPHGWLPLPFLLPCSAPGFVVLQEGRATSSDSSPLASSPSVVSEQ